MSDVALFDSVAEDGQHIQSKWKRRKSFLAERDDVTSEMLRSHDNVRRPRASSTVNAENEWQAKNAHTKCRNHISGNKCLSLLDGKHQQSVYE